MSLSEYFTPVADASVTFDGANIQLSGDFISENNAGEKADGYVNDLTFQAEGGEMVLVLGNPTSAVFKSLFHAAKNLEYSPEGSIHFKNNEFKEYGKKCPHQTIYSNEQDVHFPFLTVKQTVDFALSCKFDLSKEEREKIRNDILKEFGLLHVSDTIIGNDFVRGISGGERKRISIIETFIANGSVYLWDNSTKGLDSATALDFLTILKRMARTTKSVNFVKISQASDKIVEKFDKILMLTDNYQVFYGTVDECLSYYRDQLGIRKDPNDCIIEYLTSILNFQFNQSPFANTILNSSESVLNKGMDRSKEDLSTSYHSLQFTSDTDLYRQWIESEYYSHWKDVTSNHLQANGTVSGINPDDITPIFKIPLKQQLMLVTKRAFQRSLGDKFYLIALLISIVVQSLVIGSLFYDIPKTTIGSFSRGSLTFFSILFFTFLSLAEMPAAFQRQPVINKQCQLHFYYPWIEAAATTVFDYCYKLLLVVLFSILLYFIAHLQFSAARYFIFLLFIAIYNFSMVSLFSLTALVSPTLSIANLLAGILLLAIAMYASYVIYLKDMHPWFVWIAYLNPAMYAMEAVLTNELFDLKLDCTESVVPRGVTYENVSFANRACAWQGATLGNNYVRGRDYLHDGLSYTYKHVWRNFGILIGFICFFIACCLLAAQYIKPIYNDPAAKRAFMERFLPFLPQRCSKSQKSNVQRIRSSSSVDSSISEYNVFDNGKLSAMGEINESGRLEHVDGQKHVISWKGINYTVAGDKTLIHNVSGYISSGLTALMGESGAGKTTLLNILSQRTETGVVTGELLIDGKPLTDIAAFRRSIGFVQQQDVHLDLLTVEESLEISCNLRGDGDKNYIRTISELLKLPLDKLVGTLTPTQRKLLSIGVELVTKPSLLLFLDEPTSGLDAEAALTIVKFLKKLSLQGQAIFCTIHQPSKSVINHFDNIFLLKRGGENVYFGPTKGASAYFSSYDKNLSFDKENDNPADFIIDVVGNNDDQDSAKSRGSWVDIWEHSNEKIGMNRELLSLEEKAREQNVDFTMNAWKQPTYWEQLKLITKRQYLCTKRDRTYMAAKYLLNSGAGLFIGFSFWDIKHNINGLQNCIFFCFMALCVSSPLINQVQDKALVSKEVFIARESRSNTYHWSVLLLSQLLVELPLAITSSTLFFVCAFFCCKFNNSPPIAGVFFLNYILFSAYYLTFGLWLIYTAPNLQTAAVFVAFFYSFTASFCGVMQPYSLFPRFWTFMYRVSPYTYFVDTFVSLLLHDRKVLCDLMEFVPGQPLKGQNCGQFMAAYIEEFGGYLKNPNTFTVCAYCTYTTGDDFLKVQGMGYHHRWRNFGIECAFVAFNIFAMFAGYYLTYIAKIWPKVFKHFRVLKFKKSAPSPKETSVV
ncbi:ATP-binding cassette sterol transporter AUS1 KNAG_0L00680 [Huiozyma naganishii CBS 8797]|uniref:ABC transporter domain-containing protein n=1 Tax=Huiozyma naganishii (strain ATCC MYA-139 / BCRC 22969 / CBS 8797 / KCTC 17520 / NBRC 10181 / NCYC 3082 / Yp74L-3) TaxID=1071383 RepID=J7SB30_HUIN7|nr:hypothetical protein KNAG_0L00680 [Kazachstania naganishii CBS 8797]CCK72691.1 hypothetical protein KNAG_0L00680 [Kazachstania naganishii CBS 8797]